MRRLWLYGCSVFLAGFIFSGSARGDTTELVTYSPNVSTARFHRAHADSATIGENYNPESLPDKQVPAGNLLVAGNTHTRSLSVGVRSPKTPSSMDREAFPGIGDVLIEKRVRIGGSQPFIFPSSTNEEGPVRLDVQGGLVVGGTSPAMMFFVNRGTNEAWEVRLKDRYLIFAPSKILMEREKKEKKEEEPPNRTYPLILAPEGKVGINVEKPRYNLDIGGSANVNGYLSVYGALGVYGNVYVRDNVEVNGAILSQGRQLLADYVFHPGYPLESIEEHAAYMWENGHLKALPVVSPDAGGFEVVDIVQQQRGILEELEKAHIYIDQLNKRLAQQQREIDALKAKGK